MYKRQTTTIELASVVNQPHDVTITASNSEIVATLASISASGGSIIPVPPTTTTTATTTNTTGLVQRRVVKQTSRDSATNNVDDLFFQDEQDEEKERKKYYDVSTWEKVEPKTYKRKHKSIRRFYQQQNMLIEKLQSFYQAIPTTGSDNGSGSEEFVQAEPQPVAIAIYVSFALNVVLLIVKILASIWSGSTSVIASAADSLLDLLSGSVLVVTHRLVASKKSTDNFRYPQGKSRMEPIGVFSFAIIMMLSSLQIMIEAVRRLVSRPAIELGPMTLAILAFTIVSKAVASWYCRNVAQTYHSGAAAAYADDHRNDVMTNLVGVGAALAAVYVPSLWFLDSTGAICIAVYIIVNWLQTGNEQLRFLTGRGASPMLLQQLTYIAANHDERIKFVDTVRAYHFGVHYLVEVDIVLPEDMPLQESHDIGESLQHRLEQLEDVERAFVHNDYEWDHSPVVFRGTQIIRK